MKLIINEFGIVLLQSICMQCSRAIVSEHAEHSTPVNASSLNGFFSGAEPKVQILKVQPNTRC